jgi:hypothetical protein
MESVDSGGAKFMLKAQAMDQQFSVVNTLKILHFGRIRGFIAPYHNSPSMCLLLDVRKEIIRV